MDPRWGFPTQIFWHRNFCPPFVGCHYVGPTKKKKEREMVDRGPTALCIAFVTERMLPLREAPNPIKVGSWLCITRS